MYDEMYRNQLKNREKHSWYSAIEAGLFSAVIRVPMAKSQTTHLPNGLYARISR